MLLVHLGQVGGKHAVQIPGAQYLLLLQGVNTGVYQGPELRAVALFRLNDLLGRLFTVNCTKINKITLNDYVSIFIA